jgi:hypothetical protein
VAGSASQLEVQRQRRFEVGKGLGDEGNAVETLRGKALEFKFGDHFDALVHTAPTGLRLHSTGWSGTVARRQGLAGAAQASSCERRQGQAPWSRGPAWQAVTKSGFMGGAV